MCEGGRGACVSKGRECVKTNIDVFFTYFAHTFSRNPGSISPCFPRQTPTSALSLAPLAQDRPADMRLLPHTKRARVATHRPHRCSSLGSTLRTHSTIQRSQTHAPALLASLQSPIITVRCLFGVSLKLVDERHEVLIPQYAVKYLFGCRQTMICLLTCTPRHR